MHLNVDATLTEERMNAMCDDARALEARILETDAESLTGVEVKLRMLRTHADELPERALRYGLAAEHDVARLLGRA